MTSNLAGFGHPLAGVMDRNGMLPPDWWCTGCGRQLNEGGRRPAELYAGTFTGLCTGCMGKGPWVTEISVLDGARRVSWPPHCPSWRRDREVHIAYEDCGTCAGLGLETPAYRSWSGGGQYCRPCISRYSSHALRVWDLRWRHIIRETAEDAFQRAWDDAAGVPRRCSARRRQALREALGPQARDALKPPLRERHARILALHKGHAARLRINAWEPSPKAQAAWNAAVERRARALGAELPEL